MGGRRQSGAQRRKYGDELETRELSETRCLRTISFAVSETEDCFLNGMRSTLCVRPGMVQASSPSYGGLDTCRTARIPSFMPPFVDPDTPVFSVIGLHPHSKVRPCP